MSQQVWHAFYFDSEVSGMPTRSEVIEASCEEDAARQARNRLGGCARVSLEGASWTERRHLLIEAAPKTNPYVPTLH